MSAICRGVNIGTPVVLELSNLSCADVWPLIPYLNLDIVQAEIARQEARLKMERENLEKEKSVLMGTASNQDNQDGALEITVSGEKYRCLRFAKAKK
ncbi:unnamed protein product [Ilex paraguariensis]|uniref:Uncharacterized protein n=1 Tax=Ilex paraguariensis TaxID=185542 RepID=A0ABC8R5A2_9AQUA